MPNANRSVGADASKAQMWDAISTSVGVKAKMSTARRTSPAFNSARAPSTAGLDTAKSAWVQPHGSGYTTARKHGPKMPTDLVSSRPSSLKTFHKASGGMVDYTRGARGSSSIAKLAKLSKFNRMF